MPDADIVIRGAREHNLKNFNLRIPRDTLTVITGVSGSGKSSLAFDTIFAEGQRRYVESLSAYARQFLGRMEKPDVDHIEGLSPSISIDQKGVSRNRHHPGSPATGLRIRQKSLRRQPARADQPLPAGVFGLGTGKAGGQRKTDRGSRTLRAVNWARAHRLGWLQNTSKLCGTC